MRPSKPSISSRVSHAVVAAAIVMSASALAPGTPAAAAPRPDVRVAADGPEDDQALITFDSIAGYDKWGPMLSGETVPLTGDLVGPTTSEPVIVEMRAVGSTTWTRIAEVRTRGDGRFAAYLVHRINGVARARSEGSSTFKAATAEVRLPAVRAGLIGWAQKGTSKKGRTLTMSPKVVPSPRSVSGPGTHLPR